MQELRQTRKREIKRCPKSPKRGKKEEGDEERRKSIEGWGGLQAGTCESAGRGR